LLAALQLPCRSLAVPFLRANVRRAPQVQCLRDDTEEKQGSAWQDFAAALGTAFVQARGAKPTSTSAAFDQTLVAQCDFAWARCRQVLCAFQFFFVSLSLLYTS